MKNDAGLIRLEWAEKFLVNLGAGLQMTEWLPYATQRFVQLRDMAMALKSAVESSTGFAYFNCGDVILADWSEARLALAKHLVEWNNTQCARPVNPALAAVVAVSQETLNLAEALNELKAQWEELHGAIRIYAGTNSKGEFNTVQASKIFRELLKLMGESRLNVNASDRKIPVIRGVPLAIRWFAMNSTPIARRRVADLLEDLRGIRDNALPYKPEIWDLADAEIRRFAAMDQSTPIAFKLRERNTGHRFRATLTTPQGRETITGYAGSPILCLHEEPVIAPTLKPYIGKVETKAGDKKNVEAMGPRVRLNDGLVVANGLSGEGDLRFYYWYTERPRKEASRTKSTRNPHSATSFPGLWLGPRKTRSGNLIPTVIVQMREDRSQRRFSIEKYGLEQAWAMAAQVYSKDRNIAVDAIIARCPAKDAVDNMLQWAINNAR